MEAERDGMKRKISTLFSKKAGRSRDVGQCVAAAVIALTLTVTGAAGYAAAVFEPQTALLVEPGVVDQEEEKFPALAAKQSVLQPLPEAGPAQEQQEQPEVPAQTEVPAQQLDKAGHPLFAGCIRLGAGPFLYGEWTGGLHGG